MGTKARLRTVDNTPVNEGKPGVMQSELHSTHFQIIRI